MQTNPTFFFLLFLFASPAFFSCTTASPPTKDNRNNNPQDLVRSSCVHTRYPTLCLRTLSNYAGPANSPLDVARAALRVSLAHARRASQYLKSLQSQQPSGPGPLGQNTKTAGPSAKKRQRVALSDCVDQMADSVDELKKSLEELQHLRTATFRWQVSNAQTWVSAALTDGDTCIDGFGDGGDGKASRDVKRRITDVARVTSNALYMINRVGEGGSGKPKRRSTPIKSKN